MKRTILSLFAAAAVFSAACGKKEQPAPLPENKETYFKLPGAKGGEIDLASYAGKPVMVMFFTETCPYCRKAAPFMQKLHASYAASGLNVIGIALEDNANAPRNFAEELGVTFPLAYNGREASRRYRTQGVPYIYLLTREHDIYDVWRGYDQEYDASMIKAVETILAEK